MAELNLMNPPEWLNQKFVQFALKDGPFGSNPEFTEFNIRPATGKGDNYLSNMYRVSALLNGKSNERDIITFIVKSLPVGETAVQFIRIGGLFEKEIRMLTETLPTFQKILNEHGNFPKLFADIYYHQGDPNELLILEDLCNSGYRPANRCKGLDLKQSTMVVESLAVFHAASLEAVRRNPELTKSHDKGLWCTPPIIEKLVTEGLISLSAALESWENVSKNLPQKIRESMSDLNQKVLAAALRNDEELNVIVHGDTWTNNFMFKYEEGSPTSIKFVDYQACCYNSPVFDLLYFIFTSPQVEVRKNYLDFLLETYHRKLQSTCKKLNYPLKFSLEELRKTFFKRIHFGLAIAVTVFPVTKADSDNIQDINDVVNADGKSMTDNIFQSESFKLGMMSMLPIFMEHGVF